MIKHRFNDEIIDENRLLLENLYEECDADEEPLEEAVTGTGRNALTSPAARKRVWVGIRGDDQLSELREILNAYEELDYINNGDKNWYEFVDYEELFKDKHKISDFMADLPKFKARYNRALKSSSTCVDNLNKLNEKIQQLQDDMWEHPFIDFDDQL